MKNLIIIITALLIFLACKKKDSTTPDIPNTGSTTGGGTIDSSKLSGSAEFYCAKKINITNGTAIDAGFSNRAFVTNAANTQIMPMGNVSLNGITFKVNGLGITNQYSDTTTTNQYTIPHNWVVTGTASVPSFSYSNNNAYPVYADYAVLSDTFDVSSGLTIPLTGYNGVDEITVLLMAFDSNFNMTYVPLKTYAANITSIYFSNNELSNLGGFETLYLTVTFYKNNIQTINTQAYNFKAGLTVFAPIQFM